MTRFRTFFEALLVTALVSCAAHGVEPPRKQFLRDNWAIHSSCQVKASGEELSKPGFATAGWHHAQVPTTVVAALLADKTYPDPHYGMNLHQQPGMDYPIGKNFANLPMPDNSPYRCSWWFRTEFQLAAGFGGKNNSLHFDGINYRANIWLN